MSPPTLLPILNADDCRRHLRQAFSLSAGYLFAGVITCLGLLLVVASLSSNFPLLEIVGIGVVCIGILRFLIAGRRPLQVRQVTENSLPVWTMLVQADRQLLEQGSTPVLPCLVLFSFEDALNAEPEFLAQLAQRIYLQKDQIPRTMDERQAARIVLTYERGAIQYRRVRVPISLTNGHEVFAADLCVERRLLRDGYLTGEMLPCLAEPGETGGLELLPWWSVASPAGSH